MVRRMTGIERGMYMCMSKGTDGERGGREGIRERREIKEKW